MTEQTHDDSLVERVQEAIGDYVQSVDDAEGYENTQRIIALVRADERARLWQRAMSPEVVEAVATAVYAGGLVAADMGAQKRREQYVKQEINALLTALLGDRPEGANDGD